MRPGCGVVWCVCCDVILWCTRVCSLVSVVGVFVHGRSMSCLYPMSRLVASCYYSNGPCTIARESSVLARVV